jgi:hypothetical protein
MPRPDGSRRYAPIASLHRNPSADPAAVIAGRNHVALLRSLSQQRQIREQRHVKSVTAPLQSSG